MPRSTKQVIEPSEAELSRLAIADARAAVRQAQAEHDTETTRLASVDASIKRGTATAEEITERAELRERVGTLAEVVEGLRQRLARARRAEVADTTELADALAETVGKALGGVPVVCLNERPTVPEVADLPLAYLVQRTPCARNLVEGYLSGRVVLHYIRTPLHIHAEPVKLGHALDDAGIRMKGEPRESASYTAGRRHRGGPDPVRRGDGLADGSARDREQRASA